VSFVSFVFENLAPATLAAMQKDWTSLKDRVVLVTGASRGVGARVAELLGEAKAKVVVNYRNKGPRAEEVATEVRKFGGQAITACADLTKRDEVQRMFELVRRTYSRLDVLILNASGGLEKDAPADYAMKLNCDAQLDTVDAALPLMPNGGRVVFVTSHMAHFHGEHDGLDVYEPVAISKRAGEDALRARIPELSARGNSLIIVSGDLIDGTTTPRLMQRQRPGIIEARREAAGGWLPTTDDFASAIVDAAADMALVSGETIYVGSTK
jgi:NAD(P)-dependent dehydrogenase (short-subunit alcohol dehydrogenase family)